jgi:uncharacterized membrane protein YadS
MIEIERDYGTKRDVHKTVIALSVALLFAVGLMLLGMFIDIQIISRYDYTPISFTFAFLFCGILIGVLLALRTLSHSKKSMNVTHAKPLL